MTVTAGPNARYSTPILACICSQLRICVIPSGYNRQIVCRYLTDGLVVEHVQCIVAGAGVVGLAIARELAMAGREVLILEAENAIGTGVSSRNSCVIQCRNLLSSLTACGRTCACPESTRCMSFANRTACLISASARSSSQPRKAKFRRCTRSPARLRQWCTRSGAARSEPGSRTRAECRLCRGDAVTVDRHRRCTRVHAGPAR